jgi:hypothetical protein
MSSYSPNLFGTSWSMTQWEKMAKILNYGEDPFVLGMKPDLSRIPKSRITKNKKKLLDAISYKGKTGTVLDYDPEGLLILAWLAMSKGVGLSSRFKDMVQLAIDMEREKLKESKLGEYNRKQRTAQLNRMNNALDSYVNDPMRIDMYHSKKGRLRARKQEKKRNQKMKQRIDADRKLTRLQKDFFGEVYLLMRMFHGATETNRYMKRLCPRIDISKVREHMIEKGYATGRGIPNKMFKMEIVSRARDYRTGRSSASRSRSKS